jgi:hypothetical protein
MISSRLVLVAFLVLTFLQLSQADTNLPKTNETIDVIQLAEWIVKKLPQFNPQIVKNLLTLTPVPPEMAVAFSSAGYILIIMIIVLLLFIGFIVISIMQCSCGTCSDPKANYGTLQRGTGKVLNTLVLFTVIVICITGIVFIAQFNSVSSSLITSTETELKQYKDGVDTVHREIELIHTYNVTFDFTFDDIENLTYSLKNINSFFEDMKKDNIRNLEQILPIVVFLGIVIISIIGIVAGFFHLRCVYAFIGILFFIIFMAMLFVGLIAASGSILVSDICVEGVDNQVELIVGSTKLTSCSKDLLKQYIFCDGRNMSCSPISNSIVDVRNAIFDLNQTTNKTENVNKTLAALSLIEKNLVVLSNCSQSKIFYQKTTVTLCGDVTSSILRTSAMMILITYLSFVFFIVFYFNWNRFKQTPEGYSSLQMKYGSGRKATGIDLPSFKGSGSTSRRRSNIGEELESTMTAPQELTIGCFLYTIIIVVIWAALTFGCVAVVSIGSQKVSVNRVK